MIDSGLEFTILRPSYFMEIWLSPAVGFDAANAKATIFGTGERPISWISAARRRRRSRSRASRIRWRRNAVLELGGPRPVTPLEVVRIFESVLGRPIELTFVPAEALKALQQAEPDPMEQSFAALMRCYAQGDPIEMGKTTGLLPRPMMTVDAYAASLRTGVPTG